MIMFRIVLGIIGGIIAIKLSKNKKYTDIVAFIIGFLFPIIGNSIIYYSKDAIRNNIQETSEEEKQLEELIQKLSQENTKP